MKCRAANASGTIETQGQLIVVEQATIKAAPQFEKPLDNLIKGREGEPLRANVVAPQAEAIKWYRNGERLKVGLIKQILTIGKSEIKILVVNQMNVKSEFFCV